MNEINYCIGLKEVTYTPMTRAEYNDYRGWELPEVGLGDDKGYLIEYMDGGQSNHENHEGYISWSPKVVFNNEYYGINEGSLLNIMEYFEYQHLPERLQKVSKPICGIAKIYDAMLPDSAEKSAGLRKLLEAKDCLVRAAL